jgi:hypothetical protein
MKTFPEKEGRLNRDPSRLIRELGQIENFLNNDWPVKSPVAKKIFEKVEGRLRDIRGQLE